MVEGLFVSVILVSKSLWLPTPLGPPMVVMPKRKDQIKRDQPPKVLNAEQGKIYTMSKAEPAEEGSAIEAGRTKHPTEPLAARNAVMSL